MSRFPPPPPDATIPAFVPPGPGSPPVSPTDANNLKLLAVLYYVMAGLQAAGSFLGLGLFTFLTIVAGVAIEEHLEDPPPPIVMPVLGCSGCFVMIAGGALTVMDVLAAVSLTQRRRPGLIFRTATLNCLMIPLGTALGVFTFKVISRPGVRAMFESPQQPIC